MTLVRAATDDDLDALVRLDAALFGVNAWSRSAMRDELAAGRRDRVVLVAETERAVIGYAVGMRSAEVADLLRIGVASAARRRGVGSALLETLTTWADAAGCDRLLLEVDVSAEPALAFYRRHGFAEIAGRPAYYPDGADAAVMARPIGLDQRGEPPTASHATAPGNPRAAASVSGEGCRPPG